VSRLEDVRRFYELIDDLRVRLASAITLADCNGRLAWPRRGVYFFFEKDEYRSNSGTGPRVVRVGTHALTERSRTTLWNRLSQHAGSKRSGAGNHRGSIFRLLVGEALKARNGLDHPKSWGQGSHPKEAGSRLGQTAQGIREGERELEREVSNYIGAMPFLFVAVNDDPSPGSERGVIERNSIALLSNYRCEVIDPASAAWIGNWSGRERVRKSGMWNNNHVEETYDRHFLATLEKLIKGTIAFCTGE